MYIICHKIEFPKQRNNENKSKWNFGRETLNAGKGKMMVLVLVLLPAQGPNKERPGPQP